MARFGSHSGDANRVLPPWLHWNSPKQFPKSYSLQMAVLENFSTNPRNVYGLTVYMSR